MSVDELTEKHVRLARQYCNTLHEGQKRKTGEPYSIHPEAVAQILKKYGFVDPLHQTIALLHDTLEDTRVTVKELQARFGYAVANGVFLLSRNEGETESGRKLTRKQYLQRLAWARGTVKRVKIADAIHNSKTLEMMKPDSRARFIKDAKEHYILWGHEVAPVMVGELIENIKNYEKPRA